MAPQFEFVVQPNHTPITIVADDRERSSGVVESLAAFEAVRVTVRRLSKGDYLIDRRLIVERKTLKDFAVSVIDGRLFKQMNCLRKSVAVGVLILEGTAKDLVDSATKRDCLQGALITVSLMMGIPVLRSSNAGETARTMVHLARQFQSVARGAVCRRGYLPKTRRRRRLFILQGLPGVGRERAVRLLERFGSVEAVISASESDLQEVSGIGKVLARKIRWAVE